MLKAEKRFTFLFFKIIPFFSFSFEKGQTNVPSTLLVINLCNVSCGQLPRQILPSDAPGVSLCLLIADAMAEPVSAGGISHEVTQYHVLLTPAHN